MLTRRIFVVTALLVVLLMPIAVHAAPVEFPLVPCGGLDSGGGEQPPCTPCLLFDTFSRVINLVLFGITAPIAAFMIVLAGGMMLLGGANAGSYAKGKKMLTNTLIGVIIILLSWVATNFLIKSLGGSSSSPWYRFECPTFLAAVVVEKTEARPGPPVGLPLPSAPPAQAPKSDNIVVAGVQGNALYARLAARNNVPPIAKNSPQLNALMDCLYQDPIIRAITYPKPADNGQKQTSPGNFTYDNNHYVCNFTRGASVNGGSCSHSVGSCHTGGRKGTNGAEAIDFNALERRVVVPGVLDSNGRPKTVQPNEGILFCELYRVLVRERKCGGLWKFINWETNHTHISTMSCDVDGVQQSVQLPPGGCISSLVTPSPAP